MRYRPYHLLDGVPNVVVDGSITDGTRLTLSHWPGTPTPPGLERDLSAQMALAYARRLDLHGDAEVVTNNHFDQDGLVSAFALIDPNAALAAEAILTDVAAAGDFGTYKSRDAARISMIIAGFADPVRSPLAAGEHDASDYAEWTAILYDDLLGRLPELIAAPEHYRTLWEREDATLEVSERLVANGDVRITERPDLDLAVVEVPDTAPDAGGHRFGGQWVTGLHPMALYNATPAVAVLSQQGARCELTYRYEGWVQYRSRRPRRRADLTVLAEELTADETGGGRWVFDGVAALTPRLHLVDADESAIPPDELLGRIEAGLATAPLTWNPYAEPADASAGSPDG